MTDDLIIQAFAQAKAILDSAGAGTFESTIEKIAAIEDWARAERRRLVLAAAVELRLRLERRANALPKDRGAQA